ncbi:MAG TPA: thioesterase family protein [Myxococcaceae bacterium]|jgi:acyl-CoA thioesterase
MSSPFLTATTVTSLGEGRFRSRFDAPWYQGRGAFGGVVAAQLIRALEHEVADPNRPVRSFTVHFCAPAVEGEAQVHTRLERVGKLVSYATARVENAAGVVAVASATFGVSRAGAPAYFDVKPPDVPRPETLQPVPEDVPMPTFCQFFEYRFCVGSAPYSGGEARTGGWIRPKGPPLVLDAALCAGLMDSYPPSVLSWVDGVKHAASVDLTMHFFHALPRPEEKAGAQYLRTGHSRWAGEGFSEDYQELWSEDGTLLAQCRQLIAVLG